jgi:hypothetical protein
MIGVPIDMGRTLMIMNNSLPDHIIEKCLELMKPGIRNPETPYWIHNTGQNKLWFSLIDLFTICLEKDSENLKRPFLAAKTEFTTGLKEGIQADYSFYQHGKMLNALSYGKTFALYASKFLYLANGTTHEYSQAVEDCIFNYILDGMRWMTWGRYLDFHARGRAVSRDQPGSHSILLAVRTLLKLNSPYRNELKEYEQSLMTGMPTDSCKGNKFFWKSDYMIHRRNNFFFSLKTTSPRILQGESINSENLKGFYLGLGSYAILGNINSYNQIYPVWDWTQVPGVISPKSYSLEDMTINNNDNFSGFSYGISNGENGAMAFDFKNHETSAKRSWFCFDDYIIHISSDIRSFVGDSVILSVNQCNKSGVIKAEKSIVSHNDMNYINLSEDEFFTYGARVQSGSWYDINRNQSKEKIQREVFSIAYHIDTREKDIIQYAINADREEDKSFFEQFEILRNDSVHAVWRKDEDELLTIFYKQGYLEIPWSEDLNMQVNTSCLIHLRKTEDGSFEFIVSHPDRQQISLFSSGKYTCPTCTNEGNKTQVEIKLDENRTFNHGRILLEPETLRTAF